ncbi:3-phosphoshikimate 1-carboxyvinyltransferase [Halobacteriovorax sp.]|uniref:3-phosphoshikimate 1-carboxyvinyltransferase n=1 Tax=Halobacteriovorax sp. TaxID=2020862 RepID=UPI003564F2C1
MIENEELFTVTPEEFNKNVVVPSSKSYANRVIILASLCKESVEIINLPLSHDVTNLIAALRVVGLKILDIENGIQVVNSFPECESDTDEIIEVFPGDGGTTTRFLIPFLALGKKNYKIEPEGRMRERPIADLLESLVDIGATVSQCESWLTISGPISCSQRMITADASKTTQHATALALSLSSQNVDVLPKDMNYSVSYWEMTKSLIRDFKQGSRRFVVPVDFSSMSYILALGADLGSVSISNCTSVDQYQSDSVFLDILKEMGCEISISNEGLTLTREKEFLPIDMDCSNCPDLVPTLAFICSRTKGVSTLSNLSVLKYKESDRLVEIQKLLDLYNIENTYNEEDDLLTISGNITRVSESKNIFPPDDHRIVMASYLFLRANGGGELSSIESVSKSFNNFFEVVS